MNAEVVVPAAQYLRMSTEHQQYSFDNQRAAIQEYAGRMGFEVVKTYSDAAKSGLLLKRRDGLRQLLDDVVSGRAEYEAVLVYDVSRWGRFQDIDEAAHYEFLCKASEIQVHYCAEPFPNDDSFMNSLMKAIKRVMAAEYSRELSRKVHDGQQRTAEAGFRSGGSPGYGLRRMLVTPGREAKFILNVGEKKAIQTDRIILVPGPEEEVKQVQEMFRLFNVERMWPKAIAAKLRKEGVKYTGKSRTRWYTEAVARILRHPKYCGCSVFGQSSFYLQTVRVRHPRERWTITPGAWQPLVDQETFNRAQQRFADKPNRKTDEELLLGLRELLEYRGRISERVFNEAFHLPSIEPYRRRFGSLSEALERIGYIGSKVARTRMRRRTLAVRDQVAKEIVGVNPTEVNVVQANGHWRPSFSVGGVPVALYVCRCVRRKDGVLKWIFNVIPREHGWITLVVRLRSDNEGVLDTFVMPDLKPQVRYELSIEDPWLSRGIKLESVERLASAVRELASQSTSPQFRESDGMAVGES